MIPATAARLPRHNASASSAPLAGAIRFRSFHFDLEQKWLFKNGSRVKMQNKVSEALLILVESPGQLVTREALRTRLWPGDSQINYDANVNTTVNKLRQVLGDSLESPSFVETIPRQGYTFIAPVEPADQLKLANSESTLVARSEAPERVRSKAVLDFLGVSGASSWFIAGVISLLVASVLFGSAVVLFAHRGL